MNGFNLSALAVRERSITMFLIIAMAVIGAVSYRSLGRAEDPPFTVKTLAIMYFANTTDSARTAVLLEAGL